MHRFKTALVCIALVAMTFAVYWPVRQFPYIDFDDPEFIANNEAVKSGLNWSSIHYAFTTPVVANWHPVTTLSHALDCELFGEDPGAHHMVNVAIHSVNAALLFLVLITLMRQQIPRSAQIKLPKRNRTDSQHSFLNTLLAFFVAALFALHPLRVESVAWIAERKDVLSGMFFMLTLWAYAKYVFSKTQVSGFNFQLFYCASLLFLALGLMSKPMLVTVPFLLLLLDLWPLGRMPKFAPKTLKPLLLEKVPFLLLSAGSSILTLLTQAPGMATNTSLGLAARVGNALVSYATYLRKFLWPSDLAVFYPHRLLNGPGELDVPALAIASLVLLTITILVLLQLRRRPFLFVGWFWFVGMLVPVIGIVQVGEQSMADRYAYLPTIGLSLALSCFCLDRWAESRSGLRLLALFAATVLAACALVTSRQLQFWRGTVPLFERTLQVTGENLQAEFALGVGLDKTGQPQAARERFESVLAKNPNYSDASYNLGLVLAKQQQWEAAIAQFKRVLAVRPNHFDARVNLASTLASAGLYAEAADGYDAALKVKPGSAEAMNNFAWLLATAPDPKVRDGAKAVRLAERACELTQWSKTVMVGTLAAAYARAGKFDDAVATAERAEAIAKAAGETQLAHRNRELIKLYRAGSAYTE